MIQAVFYVEHTGKSPIIFEEILSRRFEGWTHLTGVGCWHSVKEYCQTYTIIFDDYPGFRLDLRYLANVLKRELNQDSILTTILRLEVL